MPVSSISVELARAVETVATYDTPANAKRAAHALELILRIMGPGSQNALADHMGVQRQTVHTWRTRRILMPPRTVAAIATFYGIPPDHMYAADPRDAVRCVLDSPNFTSRLIADELIAA